MTTLVDWKMRKNFGTSNWKVVWKRVGSEGMGFLFQNSLFQIFYFPIQWISIGMLLFPNRSDFFTQFIWKKFVSSFCFVIKNACEIDMLARCKKNVWRTDGKSRVIRYQSKETLISLSRKTIFQHISFHNLQRVKSFKDQNEKNNNLSESLSLNKQHRKE